MPITFKRDGADVYFNVRKIASQTETPTLLEDELQRDRELLIAGKAISAGAGVPAECAKFLGGWAGDWGSGIGPTRLWVLAITSTCGVKVAYLSSANDNVPNNFIATQIREGVLTIPCGPGGKCLFERRGDDVWANYTAGGNYGGTVFRRIK